MSWPPETTPSAAPGPEPTPGGTPPPGRYPPPAQHPAQNGAPGQYLTPGPHPAAQQGGAPGQYPPPSPHPAAQQGAPGDYPPSYSYPGAQQSVPGQYPAPGPYPAAGPIGQPAYGGGQLLAPGTFSAPPPAAPKVRLWPPSRREWTTALGLIAGLAAIGAAVAPLWVQLAPRLAFRVDQPGRALPVVPEAEEYVAADGRFVIITLVVGVVAALACWLVRRSRGPLIMVALAAGGLLGAVVTWRLGLRLGTGYQPADLQVVGKVLYQPLTLRARAALVVEPAAAVIVYLLAVGFSARNDLGRDEDQAVSSDSG